ncbi:MAG TPA: hypothetical protein VEI97_14880 [bacterium]|nr:hypothetical protein [bacterium]
MPLFRPDYGLFNRRPKWGREAMEEAEQRRNYEELKAIEHELSDDGPGGWGGYDQLNEELSDTFSDVAASPAGRFVITASFLHLLFRPRCWFRRYF